MLRSTVTGTVVLWLAVMSTAGCTQEGSAGPADSQAVPSTPTRSASPTATDPAETPQGGATDGLPDGMSELEQRLISAMASVGVEGAGVWEHGFRDAHIAGDWRGRTAFVHGYEDPAAQTPGDVVATKTFGDVVRFPCGEVGYDVASLAGDGEPGSSHIPSAVELARLLVPELPC